MDILLELVSFELKSFMYWCGVEVWNSTDLIHSTAVNVISTKLRARCRQML
jgi:hypothetical protein